MSKKPFNPVLGEELSAWVDHPKYGRTVFVCEQVSHHPPVSAVVMRNDKVGVEFNASLRFGIQFNGNSVSCSLKGRASVTFKTLNETYVCPNWVPDVVIQNVLFGTRRQLWWGDWEMQCEKTGMGIQFNVADVNVNDSWFASVQSGVYENRLKGAVYRLAEPDNPLFNLEGLAGIKVNIIDPKKGSSKVLFDCAAFEQVETLQFLVSGGH